MSRNPQELWELGFDISFAWLDLCEACGMADMEYRRMYDALRREPKDGPYVEGKGIYYEYEPKDLEFRNQKRIKLSYGLRNNLLGNLESGELIAVGFKIHPEIKSEPEIIPAGYFLQIGGAPDFDSWDRNIFEGKTAHYERVRVIDPTSFGNSVENKPKRGRPGSRHHIKEAYEACKQKNEINFSGDQIDAIRIVQKLLRKKYPDNFKKLHSGFSDEAVRLAISNDFQAKALKLKGQ